MLFERMLRQASSMWHRASPPRHAPSRVGNVIEIRGISAVRRARLGFAVRIITVVLFVIATLAIVLSLLSVLRAPESSWRWLSFRYWTGTFSVEVGGVGAIGRVLDGDTLVAGDRRIRLIGIDAPESDQTCVQRQKLVSCGRSATRTLASFVSGQLIRCTTEGVDRYGRDLSTCWRSDGANINGLMVASGWAIAHRRYSRAYELAEAEARGRGLGLWAGSFVEPEAWRAGRR